jgi:hypothetical protein
MNIRTVASTSQVVILWTELMLCLFEKNGYGGKTCEIYIYTMMAHSPTFMHAKDTESLGRAALEDASRACADIYNVVQEFQKHFGAMVLMHEGPLEDLLNKNDPFVHRVHFTVETKA